MKTCSYACGEGAMPGLWCLAILPKRLRIPPALPCAGIFGRPVLFLQRVARWAHSTVPRAPACGCLRPFPIACVGTCDGQRVAAASGEQAAGAARAVHLVSSLVGVGLGKWGYPARLQAARIAAGSCRGTGGRSLIAQLPWGAAGKLGGPEFWLEQHQNNFVILGCELILSPFKVGLSWCLEKKNLS